MTNFQLLFNDVLSQVQVSIFFSSRKTSQLLLFRELTHHHHTKLSVSVFLASMSSINQTICPIFLSLQIYFNISVLNAGKLE